MHTRAPHLLGNAVSRRGAYTDLRSRVASNRASPFTAEKSGIARASRRRTNSMRTIDKRSVLSASSAGPTRGVASRESGRKVSGRVVKKKRGISEDVLLDRRALRYRRAVKEGDCEKAEANEKFMDAVRRLPINSHVAVLDTCRLATTSRISEERPDIRVSIVEAARGEFSRIKRSLAKLHPRCNARVIHGDVFGTLLGEVLQGLDAVWIDGMTPHVERNMLEGICRKHPKLRCLAVTLTMRDRNGRSFEDRMQEMSDVLRSSAGMECKVAWGYRTGEAGCGMGLLVFGPLPARRRNHRTVDHTRVLFRPRSATPIVGLNGKPSGAYAVRWFGFRKVSTEGARILKYIQ